jgi:hypothetical protein
MASNREFLEEKLKNYKTFVRSVSNSPTKCEELDKFNPDNFLIFGELSLMPLANKEGGLNEAVEKTIQGLELRDSPEVRDKLMRYYKFLVAFLLSVKQPQEQ